MAGVAVLKGAEQFHLAEDQRVTPAPKLCGAGTHVVRCLSLRRDSSVLTDIDIASRVVERRVEGLPLMHRLWFHPSGSSLGYRKRRPIGNPSELFFLSAAGVLLASTVLPDAVGQVEWASGGWYVGCRDSWLYAFSDDGRQRWRRRIRVPAPYQIPGLRLWDPSPCLRLSAAMGLVGLAAQQRVYLVDEFGNRHWQRDLPPEVPTHEIVIGPSEVPMRHRLLERLGLSSEADHDEVRTGFVRLELQAHAGGGCEWLRKVERYEGAEGDEVSGGHPGDTVLEVVMAGMQPRNAIVTMAMGTEQIALGLLNGEIELWDPGGNRQERFRVGESPVSAVVLGSRGLRASYSGGLLTLFARAGISGCVRLPAYFARVVACGPDVLVWSGREAWVVDGKGRVVWRARFGKQIGGAVVHRVGFDVLAGHLFSFRRTCF